MTPPVVGPLFCPHCGSRVVGVRLVGSRLVFDFEADGVRKVVALDLGPTVERIVLRTIRERLASIGPPTPKDSPHK